VHRSGRDKSATSHRHRKRLSTAKREQRLSVGEQIAQPLITVFRQAASFEGRGRLRRFGVGPEMVHENAPQRVAACEGIVRLRPASWSHSTTVRPSPVSETRNVTVIPAADPGPSMHSLRTRE
jgi:hypothetical protein